MRFFLTLLALRLKAGLRSAYFWSTLALFTGLVLTLCTLLPERPRVNVSVGLWVQGGAQSRTAEQTLLANEDYRFLSYGDETALRRAVLTGEVHCAYRLSEQTERPVTLYATQGSYMTPIVNEIVLAAYLEAHTPALTAELLAAQGIPLTAEWDAYFEELRARSKPMTVELSSPGGGENWAQRYGSSSMQILLYAVLGTVFPAAAVLRALLRGTQAHTPGAALFPGRHTAAVAVAPLLADVLLGALSLLAADALLALLYPAPAYTLAGRLAGIAVLALLAALCSVAVLPLARRPGVPLLALPAAAVLWVALSGAIISPELLPGGLGALRWLSPPWYFLKAMALFGA